jgi:hypothetical protein
MKKKDVKLLEVQKTIVELKDYLPLTLRQIYYQLVSKLVIENKKTEYVMLSKLLCEARLKGLIDWDVMEDRARVFKYNSGYNNNQHFITNEFKYFLSNYQRDLQQSQDKYIEIWIEKDALSSLFNRVCKKYCINLVVCKGFSSMTFLNNYKNRLSHRKDKQPIILYFGDLDPSGLMITKSIRDTLTSKLNIDLTVKRIALSRDHVEKYNLPNSPDALKENDTRAKNYIKEYGFLAVELDSLRPDILLEIAQSSILQEIEIDKYNYQLKKQNKELSIIHDTKNYFYDYLHNEGLLYE